MNTDTLSLALDRDSIQPSELSMAALMREINLQKRPNWLLRKLMNALEKKRQEKGMGWSRAWNKYDLNVFRTHKHDMESDRDYVKSVPSFVSRYIKSAPSLYNTFATDLLDDPACMAFTFYHNHDDREAQHEGLTLSFGRKVLEDKTKRDRLDIILEDLRVGGRVDGLVDRLRIYACPWNEYKNGKHCFSLVENRIEPSEQDRIQSLYDHCIQVYHDWKNHENRQWSHWSARYIDYFGPRSFIPQNTSFN